MNKRIAEFLGWYFGDGCLSTKSGKFEFTITGDLKEEISFYEEVMVPQCNKLFGKLLKKEVKLRKYPSVGVCGIYIFNKNFVNYLQESYGLKAGKKLNVNIPNFQTLEEKRHFLRGLFDTDGSIYFCRCNVKTKKVNFYNTFHSKPKIKLATISEGLIKKAFIMLTELGFSPRFYSPRKQRPYENTMYSIVLDTKINVEKWLLEIGFRSQKHSTKVEIWRKYGFCPPHTTFAQRQEIISGKMSPFSFYSFKRE